MSTSASSTEVATPPPTAPVAVVASDIKDEASSAVPTAPTGEAPKLSKKATKRLAKAASFKEHRKSKKKELKERTKKKKAEAKEANLKQRAIDLAAGVKTEADFAAEDAERRAKGKRRGRVMREEGRAKLVGAPQIVMDCGWDAQMLEKEIKSLVKQIGHCYGKNLRHAHPARLHLTNFDGNTERELKKVSGFDKWTIQYTPQSYLEAFADQKDNLVYLTAESPNVLTHLDPKAIYIIGGIVDHNRLKGTAHTKALSQGLQTARLPIDIYMSAGLRSVITCNQVYEILLEAGYTSASPDWPTIFKNILPQRWKWKEKSVAEADAAAALAAGTTHEVKYTDNDDHDQEEDDDDTTAATPATETKRAVTDAPAAAAATVTDTATNGQKRSAPATPSDAAATTSNSTTSTASSATDEQSSSKRAKVES